MLYCKMNIIMIADMNVNMNKTNKQSSIKNKKELNIDPKPNMFRLQSSPSQPSSSYNAYNDKHTSSYFQQKSVQKHLKKIASAVQNQPRSKKNSSFMSSISQWIKPPAIRQNQFRNRGQSQKVQNKPRLARIQTDPCSAKNQEQNKLKYKGSPYRVFPIFIKVQSNRHVRKNVCQSTCTLPQIETPECKVQQVSRIIQNKLSKVGKRQKKRIDNLHSLKHKQFLQF